jgi:site-specific DNA recombinase
VGTNVSNRSEIFRIDKKIPFTRRNENFQGRNAHVESESDFKRAVGGLPRIGATFPTALFLLRESCSSPPLFNINGGGASLEAFGMTNHRIRRAGIYTRFSTEHQNERSCEDQAHLCRQLAAREGLAVVAVYQDAAKSGGTRHGRSGLAKLLDDAEAGRFDIVIVEALDRLSRDMEDLAGIHKRLTFRGIEIRTVNEGVADTVSVGLRGLVGQLFREDGAKKIRRGMSAVVRDGRNAGGRAYGYKPVPGKPGELEIIEEEAAIVRRIFSEYQGGATPRTIAGRLNAEGVSPPRGKRWNASTINGNRERGNGLLLNPIYGGKIVWNRLRMVRDP